MSASPHEPTAPPPRRILLTLDAPDRSGVAFGCQNLVAGLQRRGARVRLLARRSGERAEDFALLGIPLEIRRWYGLPFLGRPTRRAVQAFGPETIHAQSCAVAWRSWRLARALGVPMTVTVNRIDECDSPFLAKHPEAGIVAVSDAIRERLTNRAGIARGRIRVIPNGLDLAHFPPPHFEAADAPAHLPVVGTYGTLIEQKGQRTFLRAARAILERGVEAEFLIIGQGPDKPALRRLAEELGIAARVTFSHQTSVHASGMRCLDVFVEPSYQEGFGLSVLQAMAMGAPVVASGVGGIYSLVEDGEDGLLVPSGDPTALANGVCQLLAAPARRREMARHARERVEREFSADRVADRVLAFYAERASPERDAR